MGFWEYLIKAEIKTKTKVKQIKTNSQVCHKVVYISNLHVFLENNSFIEQFELDKINIWFQK